MMSGVLPSGFGDKSHTTPRDSAGVSGSLSSILSFPLSGSPGEAAPARGADDSLPGFRDFFGLPLTSMLLPAEWRFEEDTGANRQPRRAGDASSGPLPWMMAPPSLASHSEPPPVPPDAHNSSVLRRDSGDSGSDRWERISPADELVGGDNPVS